MIAMIRYIDIIVYVSLGRRIKVVITKRIGTK